MDRLEFGFVLEPVPLRQSTSPQRGGLEWRHFLRLHVRVQPLMLLLMFFVVAVVVAVLVTVSVVVVAVALVAVCVIVFVGAFVVAGVASVLSPLDGDYCCCC